MPTGIRDIARAASRILTGEARREGSFPRYAVFITVFSSFGFPRDCLPATEAIPFARRNFQK
jgi:hypothetical protein